MEHRLDHELDREEDVKPEWWDSMIPDDDPYPDIPLHEWAEYAWRVGRDNCPVCGHVLADDKYCPFEDKHFCACGNELTLQDREQELDVCEDCR